MYKFFIFKMLPVAAFLTLLGAGCSLGKKPVDLSYLKDAELFGQLGGPIAPGGSKGFVPAPPAPIESENAAAGEGDQQAKPEEKKQLEEAPRDNNVYIKPTSTAGAAGLSYLQALSIYQKSGFYIQLSACHGIPGQMSLKRSARFMLDNRDRAARVVKFGDKSMTIGGLGYAVTAAPERPGVYYLTCNGGGAAVLNVQP